MRALFLLLVLAGCGSGGQDESANDNHGYGFAYDVQGSGLRLRYTPVLEASDPHAQIAFYETEYAAVEQCTGMSAPPPPFIIVVEPGTMGVNASSHRFNGLEFSNPFLIVVDTSFQGLRHEMIHYLLERVTGDADANHVSTLFVSCS